jgi:hypothetical protein
MNTPDYLQKNFYWISKLFGKHIKEIDRVFFSKNNDSEKGGRVSVEPLLISTEDGLNLYIDLDEGMANIIVYEVNNDKNLQSKLEQSIRRMPIYPSQKSEENNIVFSASLRNSIKGIDIISRENEPFDFYKMCGFRVRFQDENHISIGAYINPSKTSDICLLTQNEVDENLHYETFLG